MHTLSKSIYFSFLTFLVFSFSTYMTVAAVTPSWGAKRIVYEMPCTCTPGIFWYVFDILYLNPTGVGPITPMPGGALTGFPEVAFSAYVLKPGSAILGTYMPGPPSCYVGAEPYCVPLIDEGFILPETGVSPAPAIV